MRFGMWHLAQSLRERPNHAINPTPEQSLGENRAFVAGAGYCGVCLLLGLIRRQRQTLRSGGPWWQGVVLPGYVSAWGGLARRLAFQHRGEYR